MKHTQLPSPAPSRTGPLPQAEFALAKKQIGMPLVSRVAVIHSQLASRISWHAHDQFEILFLSEGATSYEFDDGRIIDLPGGHFLVIPPDRRHRGLFNVRHPVRLCGVMFSPSHPRAIQQTPFLQRDLKWLHERYQQQAMTVCRMSTELRRLVKSLKAHIATAPSQQTLHPAMLRSLLCLTLMEAARQLTAVRPVPPSHAVGAAITYLEKHYAEQVTMKKVAAVAQCSRARFFAAFKESTGMGPNDFLQRLRVRHAQAALQSSNQSITSIAQTCGFSTSQYFCNVFRKYTGATPTEFRDRLAGL